MRLYGLLKIHKQGVPLRHNMSTTGVLSYHLAKHLPGLLVCHTGNSPHHIKNLKDFAQTLGSLDTGPKGTIVSFDVVSLFIRMPTSLLSWHFEEHILRLFLSCLDSLILQFYEQIGSMTVGSPLSLAIANFFMDFEEMVLDQAVHKPLCLFCYMVDMFVIWPHGPERLKDFLGHPNIQVIIEIGTFPSLTQIFIGDPMTLWAIKYTINLPLPTST